MSQPDSKRENNMTNAIAVFVNDAIKHLQSQSYADSGRGQSFSRWFRSMENAVEILREAKSRVMHPALGSISTAS